MKSNFSLLIKTILNCNFSGELYLGNLRRNPYADYAIDEPEYISDPPKFNNVLINNMSGPRFREELMELFQITLEEFKVGVSKFEDPNDKIDYILDHKIEIDEAIRAIGLNKYKFFLKNADQIKYMGGQSAYDALEERMIKFWIGHLVVSVLEPLQLKIRRAEERADDEKKKFSKQEMLFQSSSLAPKFHERDLIIPMVTINRLFDHLSQDVLKKEVTRECFQKCFSVKVFETRSCIDYEDRKKLYMIETLRQIFSMPEVKKRLKKMPKPPYVDANFNLLKFDQRANRVFKHAEFKKKIEMILKEN